MLLYFHTYVIWSLIHYPRDREQDPLHAHMTFIHFYDCRSDIEFFLWMSDSQIVAENEKIKSKTWFEWLSIQSEWKIRLLSLELLRPDLEWTKHVLETSFSFSSRSQMTSGRWKFAGTQNDCPIITPPSIIALPSFHEWCDAIRRVIQHIRIRETNTSPISRIFK